MKAKERVQVARESLAADDLQSWVGRAQSEVDIVGAQRVAELAATLDDARTFSDGDELPLGWHWILFHKCCPTSQLDQDGHPRRGDFLPPVALPRRMWAGGTLRRLRPLHVGEPVERRSVIVSISSKTGQSGSLVFVVLQHQIIAQGAVAIEERQDIVYRPAPAGGQDGSTKIYPDLLPAWQHSVRPNPVVLFRYSALTFNSHRIHYDREYAMRSEGYPGLLVHGPLIATFMLQLLSANLPMRHVRSFTYRGVSPLFDVSAFRVCGRPSDEHAPASLWAESCEGHLAMTAKVDFMGD
jgi:3-methylfumaryl-CoA hydratase